MKLDINEIRVATELEKQKLITEHCDELDDLVRRHDKAQLPPNTGWMAFKHVAVYARSALAEQSTPVFEELSDAFPTLAVNFTDHEDLDEGDIGGTLSLAASTFRHPSLGCKDDTGFHGAG
ncbi:Irgc [Symbiodinium sp. CCMP2592]|nr:Irgc [Symbiodinium sp. CCMP2592]